MKIVKYVFLLLLLAAVAVTVFIATQEGKYDIRKEKVISVPKTVLYNYINDYRNWEYVGVLTDNDTTAVFTYSDNTSGLGAVTNWKIGNTQGRVQTVKVAENDSIIQKAVIDSQPSDIAWGFSEAKSGTKVSVRLKGELSFQDKAYAILNGGVKERLESVLDKGLENLNTFLVHELSTYDVEVKGLVGKTGGFYLKQTSTAPMGEMNKKAGAMLARLISFTKTNKIVGNGAPFTLLKSFGNQNDTITFAVCVPIKEEIFTTPGSEFEGGKLEPFTALKTTLKGDYSHISKAIAAARKHINAKGLNENTGGHYVEVYTRNIAQTKKPSEWITDIYIPIGPTTLPAEDPATAAAVTSTSTTATPGTVKPSTRTVTTSPKPAARTTTTPPTGTVKPSTGTATATPKPAGTTTTPVKKPAATPSTTTPPKTPPTTP